MRYLDLFEHNFERFHVWHGTTKDKARELIESKSIHKFSEGYFGYGFYTADDPILAKNHIDKDGVILEYRVNERMRILDLKDPRDWQIWKEGKFDTKNPNLWKYLVKQGIDGIYERERIAELRSFEGICFFNPKALSFVRVYSGVVDDPLAETDTNELDEFALGGLQRCTAVTVNALLSAFHLRPITINDVPIDNPGVLRILDAKGLSYQPFFKEAGRTVKQFAGLHKIDAWYLLTPGHAMALIRGELFDAENKGPDLRKLQGAYKITRR